MKVNMLILISISSILTVSASAPILSLSRVEEWFCKFNADDEELYRNEFPNEKAFESFGPLIPRFECPDENIERIYYFRWWTYRKHLRRVKDGSGWVSLSFFQTSVGQVRKTQFHVHLDIIFERGDGSLTVNFLTDTLILC
jgi:hypothetical protein